MDRRDNFLCMHRVYMYIYTDSTAIVSLFVARNSPCLREVLICVYVYIDVRESRIDLILPSIQYNVI